jgi:hypothetical protein
MFVAVGCTAGHKRSYPDAARNTLVGCRFPGCGLQVHVPPRMATPCYQTAPLIPRAYGNPASYSPILVYSPWNYISVSVRQCTRRPTWRTLA